MSKLFKYMRIADATASFSKDTSTQVGAVIIGPAQEVRSLGYNGAPRGCSADESGEPRGVRPEKYMWYSHAESNAIANAARVGTPLDGSTMVVTHFPCMDCARLIVQSGIKRVISNRPSEDFESRWAEHISRAMKLFSECGVDVQVLPPSSDQLANSEVNRATGNSEGGNSPQPS